MSTSMGGNIKTIDEIGPLFIGVVLNYLFTGILVHQLYDYNKNYPNDRKLVKWFVYGVCVLDLLQTGFSTHFAWFFVVHNWGNIDEFSSSSPPTWTSSTMPVMAGVVAMMVQFFYAWRIWFLGGRRVLKACSIAIVIVAFIQCLCPLIGSIEYAIIQSVQIPSSTVAYFVIWQVGGFVCDILIMICMTKIFSNIKSETSSRKTSSVLNILIRHTVETAAITAICSGFSLVLFVRYRSGSNVQTVPAFMLGKLYTNCLLANLNNRMNLTSAQNSDTLLEPETISQNHDPRRHNDRERGLAVPNISNLNCSRESYSHLGQLSQEGHFGTGDEDNAKKLSGP